MSIEDIIDAYGIDVNHTKSVYVRGLRKTSEVFRVESSDATRDLYIIDTVAGRKIACHPSIVGKRLEKLSLSAAEEAAKAINYLALSNADIPKKAVVFEHVLRAAPGYQLLPALKKIANRRIFETYIRPKYVEKSYRNHVSRDLKTVYSDFSSIPYGRSIILIKPDTEATGASGELAIEEAVRKSKEMGSTITDVVLYGFMALPALKLLEKTAQKHSIRLYAFAIEDVTQLAHNNYDMTIYGLDENYYTKTGSIKRLGSIIDRSTLEKCLSDFVPGCDQPGDWSSRQETLNTGGGYEKGDIKNHLQKSIDMIESLRKISGYEEWQDEIAKKELKRLRKVLKEQS